MPKYVIERNIPQIGAKSESDLRAVWQKSCSIVAGLGPQIQWVHSYLTEDKLYCIYIAPNEEMVLEHARRGGFPADRVSQVVDIVDPTSAEEPARRKMAA